MSTSSESDLENLNNLSDWNDSEEESVITRNYRRRIDYTVSLDSSEFKIRFRIDKTAVDPLLCEILPYLRVTSTR